MYRGIAARRGAKIACGAVARTILEIAYFMIRDGTSYRDLGTDYLDNLRRDNIRKRSVKRLESIGYLVTIEDTAITT
jgi:hypothetical protein